MKVLRRRTAAENGSLHSLKGSPEHCAAKKTVFDFVKNIHRDGGCRSIRLNTKAMPWPPTAPNLLKFQMGDSHSSECHTEAHRVISVVSFLFVSVGGFVFAVSFV